MAVEQLIFTDLSAGKGLKPEATGYQIKACSPDLPRSARDVLSHLCAHYGDAVYRHAPRRAKESERAWLDRHRNERLRDVPEDVLAEFPSTICYTRLRQDLFALTQIRYYGRTHDGRLGNFFARSLVFHPDLLVEKRGNPLALARSGALLSDDASDDTCLPSLPALPEAATAPATCDLLADELCREHLPALVEALVTAPVTGRSVVVCLRDWRQAVPFVETVLEALPAAARAQTTICTYESDRNWRSPVDERGDGRTAAHHLLVLCGEEERAFNLRADEYQSRFAVFNFVGTRFSKLGEPGSFAAFSAACVLDGRTQRLRRHHALVERLGVSEEPEAWDRLVPVVRLEEGEPTLAKAVHCLAELAIRPAQARSAMELLFPHVQTLAAADDAEALAEIGHDLGLLSERLTATEPFAEVRDLAGKALAEGRMRSAVALLEACGGERDRQLEGLLERVLGCPPAPAAAADREIWMDLLLEGLRLTQEESAAKGLRERLLSVAFRAAADMDRVAELWEGRAGQLVRSQLDGTWDDAKKALALELLQWITVERCAPAHAWLQLELLPRDHRSEDVMERLVGAAAAAGRSADKALVSKLIAMVGERFSEASDRAPVLGRMAEATADTPAHEALRAAYAEVLGDLEGKERNAVYRRLAEAGAERVLSDQLLAEVLPWDGKESRRKLEQWSKVFGEKASLWHRVGHLVAMRLREAEELEGTLSLAHELLRRRSSRASGDARRALVSAIALALPPEPLSEGWQRLLTPLPDDIPAPATARLRVLDWMVKIERRARESDWSAIRFPHSDPIWQRDVKSLGGTDRERILAWGLELCARNGLSEPEEARELIRLLQAVDRGSPDAVAAAIGHLLRERDPVTRVLVAAAFARDALQEPRWDPDRAMQVAAIVKQFDRSTRRLLAQHLIHRFGQRDPHHERRLRQLGRAAEIPGLRSVAHSVAGAEPKPSAPRQEQEKRFWDLLLRFLRGVLAGSKITQKPGIRSKRET